MTVRTALRGIFGDRRASTAGSSTVALPGSAWDNVGLAVDHTIDVFVQAASTVPGVTAIEAKSSGPTVYFLVLSEKPWDEVVDGIERELFPLAKAGELPPLDYEVRPSKGSSEAGFLRVFPG